MIQKRKYSSRSNPRLGLCVIGLLRSSLIINVLFQVIGSVWNDKWGMQCKKKKKIMVRALLYLCFWMPVLLRTDRVPVRTVKVHLAKLFLQSHFGKFCHVPDQSRWSQTTVHSHFTGTVELFFDGVPFSLRRISVFELAYISQSICETKEQQWGREKIKASRITVWRMAARKKPPRIAVWRDRRPVPASLILQVRVVHLERI